jgi:hypothetical protein
MVLEEFANKSADFERVITVSEILLLNLVFVWEFYYKLLHIMTFLNE